MSVVRSEREFIKANSDAKWSKETCSYLMPNARRVSDLWMSEGIGSSETCCPHLEGELESKVKNEVVLKIICQPSNY